METKFFIKDNTANTRKVYICENGENTSLQENAEFFDTKEEAQDKIEKKDWSAWAYVSEEEI